MFEGHYLYNIISVGNLNLSGVHNRNFMLHEMQSSFFKRYKSQCMLINKHVSHKKYTSKIRNGNQTQYKFLQVCQLRYIKYLDEAN